MTQARAFVQAWGHSPEENKETNSHIHTHMCVHTHTQAHCSHPATVREHTNRGPIQTDSIGAGVCKQVSLERFLIIVATAKIRNTICSLYLKKMLSKRVYLNESSQQALIWQPDAALVTQPGISFFTVPGGALPRFQ